MGYKTRKYLPANPAISRTGVTSSIDRNPAPVFVHVTVIADVTIIITFPVTSAAVVIAMATNNLAIKGSQIFSD